jgi:hypothetical protein
MDVVVVIDFLYLAIVEIDQEFIVAFFFVGSLETAVCYASEDCEYSVFEIIF